MGLWMASLIDSQLLSLKHIITQENSGPSMYIGMTSLMLKYV